MKDTILTMAMVVLLFLGFSGIALSGEGKLFRFFQPVIFKSHYVLFLLTCR
jgi:hypothetical protein